MPPYDFSGYAEMDDIRVRAERLVLARHTDEVEREVELLKKDSEMRRVARELHELAPRKTIGIIKMMRLIYGLGLKEAKDIVEQEAPLPF